MPGGARPDTFGLRLEFPVSAGCPPAPDTLQALSGTGRQWSHTSGQAKYP